MNNLNPDEILHKYFRMKLFCDVYTTHSCSTIKPPIYYAEKALEIFDRQFGILEYKNETKNKET